MWGEQTRYTRTLRIPFCCCCCCCRYYYYYCGCCAQCSTMAFKVIRGNEKYVDGFRHRSLHAPSCERKHTHTPLACLAWHVLYHSIPHRISSRQNLIWNHDTVKWVEANIYIYIFHDNTSQLKLSIPICAQRLKATNRAPCCVWIPHHFHWCLSSLLVTLRIRTKWVDNNRSFAHTEKHQFACFHFVPFARMSFSKCALDFRSVSDNDFQTYLRNCPA